MTTWQMERELLPILSEIHHKGIRVDDARRHEASEMLSSEVSLLKSWLVKKAGQDFNTNSAKQKAVVFKALGLEYKMTEKGNPSFKAEDLLPYGIDPDPENFAHQLVTHNKLLKLKRDFVDRMEDFMVQSFAAPYAIVTRKADGERGTLTFQHNPRFYFDFTVVE